GTIFLWVWTAGTSYRDANGMPETPPEQILWLNPFVAQGDVACGTEGGFGTFCGAISTIVGDTGSAFGGPTGGIDRGVAIPPQVVFDANGNPIAKPGAVQADLSGVPQADSLRDRFWPKTVISYLVLATILTLWSVQLVSPTRRWHPNVRGRI